MLGGAAKYIVAGVTIRTHPSDDGPVLDSHLGCARCGYDLAGTHVLRRCPECGLEIVATLAASADPEASRLADPEQPRAASMAILALAFGPFLAVALQASGPAMRTLDMFVGRGASFPSQVERPSWLVSGALMIVAAVLADRGLSARRNPMLRATVGPRRVRSIVLSYLVWGTVLVAGFCGSLMEGMQVRSYAIVVLAAQLLPATLALAFLGPAVGRIGALSRTYREAKHGRQSAELVTVTMAASITLAIAGPALIALGYGEIADIAAILALVLGALTLLGLAYLVANAWVVSTALRAPRIDMARML